MIQPVMLVPTMAPIMTAMAWRTFIMPELTKPTSITEVAEEDWITAVTPAPRSTPLKGVLDRRYSTSSSRFSSSCRKGVIQLAAGHFFQAFAHQGHAEEEQRHTAEQRNHIGKAHKTPSLLFLMFRLSVIIIPLRVKKVYRFFARFLPAGD